MFIPMGNFHNMLEKVESKAIAFNRSDANQACSH